MKEYTGTVAKSWMPTYENVTREFITETLYKILFSEDLPNFKFEFREDEAIDFIEDTLKSYSNKFGFSFKAVAILSLKLASTLFLLQKASTFFWY